MKILSVQNPVYSRENKTAIDCMVTTDRIGTVPFTATHDDKTVHSEKIWKELMAGKHGPIAPYILPPAQPEPVPDLAVQIFRLLKAKGILTGQDLHPSTLAEINGG